MQVVMRSHAVLINPCKTHFFYLTLPVRNGIAKIAGLIGGFSMQGVQHYLAVLIKQDKMFLFFLLERKEELEERKFSFEKLA